MKKFSRKNASVDVKCVSMVVKISLGNFRASLDSPIYCYSNHISVNVSPPIIRSRLPKKKEKN